MSVWDEVVGQAPVVDLLSHVVAEPSTMTHAWLFTGPPGSGRSTAALAFAAALQCPHGGCGSCDSCVTAAAGSHPDITRVSTQGTQFIKGATERLVKTASLTPISSPWQVIVLEDADRLNDTSGNYLLKSIEEPPPRTVWILCAPAVDDVLATIRSRCRAVLLRTPPTPAVARLLVERDGIEPDLAARAAAVAQGHIGRARGLARDPDAWTRRRSLLEIPARLDSLGAATVAAQELVGSAQAAADARCADLDANELSTLRTAWGVEDRGRRPAGYAGALSALTKDQKRRRTRQLRDAIDSVLLDLLALCRDVMAVQVGAARGPADLINADVADVVRTCADRWTTTSTLAAIDAIVDCRACLDANAAPQLALERLMARFVPSARHTSREYA